MSILDDFDVDPETKQALRVALERTRMSLGLTVNAGLATASIERMVAGGRRVEVTRMRITGAGRRALTTLRWP
jgi:hypothetical protein